MFIFLSGKLESTIFPHALTELHLSTECYSDSSYLVDHFSLDRILQIPQRGSQRTENSIDREEDKFTTGGTQSSAICSQPSLSQPYFLRVQQHKNKQQQRFIISYPAPFRQGEPQHRSILYISHKEIWNSEELNMVSVQSTSVVFIVFSCLFYVLFHHLLLRCPSD